MEKQKQEKLMKKTIILLILLAIIISFCFGREVYIREKQEAYDLGVEDGVFNTILQINQRVEVPVIIHEGNQSIIDWQDKEEICTG